MNQKRAGLARVVALLLVLAALAAVAVVVATAAGQVTVTRVDLGPGHVYHDAVVAQFSGWHRVGSGAAGWWQVALGLGVMGPVTAGLRVGLTAVVLVETLPTLVLVVALWPLLQAALHRQPLAPAAKRLVSGGWWGLGLSLFNALLLPLVVKGLSGDHIQMDLHFNSLADLLLWLLLALLGTLLAERNQ